MTLAQDDREPHGLMAVRTSLSVSLSGLVLCMSLAACDVTTRSVVTTTAYQGVDLDIIRLEKQPRTTQGDAQESLVIECAASGRVLLTQRFFPGPDWSVLWDPGRITPTAEGLVIEGVSERIVLRPAQVAACS